MKSTARKYSGGIKRENELKRDRNVDDLQRRAKDVTSMLYRSVETSRKPPVRPQLVHLVGLSFFFESKQRSNFDALVDDDPCCKNTDIF